MEFSAVSKIPTTHWRQQCSLNMDPEHTEPTGGGYATTALSWKQHYEEYKDVCSTQSNSLTVYTELAG